MTIGIGIHCADGLVLCTDSQESDGISKRNVAKIREIFRNQEWGIAVLGAGEGDYIESFQEELGELLADKGDFDETWFLRFLRQAARETRKTYPSDEMALLIGFYRQTKNKTSARIIRLHSSHPGPVHYWQTIGIGGHLSDFFLKIIYSPSITVEEAFKLAVFTVGQAKEHVDSCGGPTVAWTWTFGDTQWRPQKCEEIEARLKREELKQVLSSYWKAKI